VRQPDQGGELPPAPATAGLGLAAGQPARPLWRDRWFVLFWGGQGVSVLGSAVTEFALPTLAVLTLHAGAAQVGLLIALDRVAFPVLALPVGALVDRLRKRPLMIACNLGRALLLGSIPAAAVAGVLGMPLLYAVALLTGTLTVFFDIAYLAYVPGLVGRERLLRANTLMEVNYSVAGLVGPGLAGVLVQLVGAARTIVLDAASYVVSVVSLLLVRKPEPPLALREAGASALREIADGLAIVFRHPVLRSLTITMGFLIVAGHAVEPVALVLAYRRLHMAPGVLGIAFSLGGVGAILGTAVSGPVGSRLGSGPTIAATTIAQGAALGVLALALVLPPAIVYGAAFFLIGLTSTVNNIFQQTLRQLLTPDSHLARMNSVFRTVYWGAWPLGNLLGGAAGAAFGALEVVLASSLVAMVAGLAMFLTPLRSVREVGS
jgi:predicted MFS family arabinose efflux permease